MKTKKIYKEGQLLARRLAGELPQIDIAGTAFVVDWQQKELRAADDASKKISLEYMPMDEDRKHYICFYHLPSMSVVIIDDTITSLPEDTVMLQIPNQLALDPVGVAREYGLKDTAVLQTYPLQASLKATVVPLAETGLPDFIRRNQEKNN